MSCQRVALRLRGQSTTRAIAAVSPTTVSASPLSNAADAVAVSSVARQRSFVVGASHQQRSIVTRRAGTRSLRTSAAADAAADASASSTSERNVVDILQERGLLDACTNEDELRKAASEGSISVYCGFDPTADSLHLGNLLGIVVLAWFQRCGHTPVALLGGATGRVGDPSGKSAERPVLDEDTINANTAGIQKILEGVLANGAGSAAAAAAAPVSIPAAKVMNNLDWFGSMGFLEFLREVGKYARVGTMMAKDSVKTRLDSEQGMSFTEFSYQLLQGYDFVHLFKEHGVRVQVGGSDQWGNITAGTDLIRRILAREGAYGCTFPLLLKADGRKFGKSEEGAVWLSADRLSPYKFYQYMLQSTDADVIRFMRMLTFVPMDEISALEAAMQEDGYAPNAAQARLAEEVTRFVHGEEGLAQALKATEGLKPGADTVLDAATLEALAGDIPTAALPRDEVVGRTVVDVMTAAGLQSSKGEARRMIKGGGARLNNVKVAAEDQTVGEEDVIEGRVLLLAAGKKNKLLVRVV